MHPGVTPEFQLRMALTHSGTPLVKCGGRGGLPRNFALDGAGFGHAR